MELAVVGQAVRTFVASRCAAMRGNERGDAYNSTVMIAIGVIVAITVGAILLAKFTQSAEDIDTTPPAPAAASATP